jgi:hypothetical protein
VFPALWIHWLMGTHLTDLNCPEVWTPPTINHEKLTHR